jgi:hemolysin activation/secretion protein
MAVLPGRVLVFLCWTWMLSPAMAQTPPRPPPAGSPIPYILPTSPPQPGTAIPVAPAGPLPNEAPDVPVRVVDSTVVGTTAFPAADIDKLTGGLVGPAIPLRQIEAARLALVSKYRDGGYPLVDVTASLLKGGHLRFVVSEGYIAEVKLDGDIGPAATQVLRFLNHLTEQRPVTVDALERWLLLAQDIPGISVQAVLRPSESEPGALTLVARVHRSAYSGLFTADNRAYDLTGPNQWLGVFDFNSFTSLGERMEFSLYGSFNQTQIFGQASSEFFVGSSGLRVRLYAGDGDTNPSGQLRTIGYEAQTITAGIQATYPLLRSRQDSLNLVGVFDTLQTSVYLNNVSTAANTDSLRVLRFGGDYNLQDYFAGDQRPGTNQISARISQGLPILGASRYGSPSAARTGEQVDFTKLSGEISRNQTLLSLSPGTTIGLLALATGQYSGNVLPPAEKFYLGGLRITRGFYAGEVTGDSALAVTAELQFNTGLEMSLFGQSLDTGLQFYGFYDWGYAWQNLRSDPDARLQSYGAGLRMTVTQYTELDVEGVARLTRQPPPSGAKVTPLSARAIYWRVLTRF